MELGLGKKKPEESQTAQPAFDNTKIYIWVKGLESKVNNLLREVDVLKNDFIKRFNKLNKDLKTTNDDLLETKHEQEKTLQKMDLIIKELKQTAGIEEVMTIKKYVEFWNPMNFVTQNDLDRAIESKMGLAAKPAPEPVPKPSEEEEKKEKNKKNEELPIW